MTGSGRIVRALAALAIAVCVLAVPSDRANAGVSDGNLRCLADNIYFEARDDGPQGWAAVGNVTLNRWSYVRRTHPRTSICDVVYAGSGHGRHHCQFSWTCDGRPKVRHEVATAQAITRMADELLASRHQDPTAGAFYFHERGVHPKWAHDGSAVMTIAIGRHFFYRPADGIGRTELASIR